MKHGVGEVGVRGKMIQDGVSSSKTDLILQHARRVLEENKALMASHGVAPVQKKTSPSSKVTTTEEVVASPKAAEEAPSARDAMMAMLAKRQKANEEKVEAATPIVADPNPHADTNLRNDVIYAKYLKMIKVGCPIASVAAKMVQEQVCATHEQAVAILAKSSEAHVPPASSLSTPTEMNSIQETRQENGLSSVPASEHPLYAKYFRMLKMGLPLPAVKHKMVQEGVDPSFLDKNPTELIPLDSSNKAASTVAVSEHPSYAKYFKMKNMGLPVDAVKHKMRGEGVDPAFLDKDPSEQVPAVSPSDSTSNSCGGGLAGLLLKKSLGTVDKAQQQQHKQQQPRKKKLFWKGLDASKVTKDSLWFEAKESGDGVVALDETEFNKLFVEAAPSAAEVAAKQAEAAVQEEAAAKKKRINLIDPKRGQNGGIALARLKVPFSLVRTHISNMNDECFTIEQLRSLEEFLPTQEEADLLKNFKGDASMLGQAEKYMREMLGFTSAAKHIQCMIYKQQFQARALECSQTVEKIDKACDDVKSSKGLKKVLLTILTVGNQMNDGAGNIGFSLDSLLKLQSAKAFDKKTSILSYVITLVHRSDEASLQFPLDLAHVAEASRLTLDGVVAEKCQLVAGLENCSRILSQATEANPSFVSFLQAAECKCEELNSLIESAREKYTSVLNYFGEDTSLQAHEFFTTISKFAQDFVHERDVLERHMKADARRMQQQTKDKESKENRRMSTNSAGISGHTLAKTMLQKNASNNSPRRASIV